jgi:hypothetical protein
LGGAGGVGWRGGDRCFPPVQGVATNGARLVEPADRIRYQLRRDGIVPVPGHEAKDNHRVAKMMGWRAKNTKSG